MARLAFHGAAETVTGSKYLIETDRSRVLIDCGMFQGLKRLRLMNWDPLPFEPSDVDAVVLTHAHIDHSGYLPRFVRRGFHGDVICTPPTEDLIELLLFDSAKNQEQDAEYANRKGFSKHKPAQPLYDSRDVVKALRLVRTEPRDRWFEAADGVRCRFHDAGHLLGSAMIEVEVDEPPKPLRLLFSGDVGRFGAPLYHDPTPPCDCDYLICESTYGDRDHPDVDLLDELAEVVDRSVHRGGVMVVAAFAVGRAQQLIYLLQILIAKGRIPELPIFLDSPMAINATNIFAAYPGEHDLTESELAGISGHRLDGRNVHLSRTVAESKRINDVPGPAIIISSSGMMTGGRILHHLRRRLPDDRNTVLLTGYMAEGTRGRRLKEGAKTLRMHGRDVRVQAAIEAISGLGGHADRRDLLRWLAPLAAPRRVFLTHGEPQAAAALAEQLSTERGWRVVIPKLGETFFLEADQ
ncbi:MAG: MBL fold metallo-hydrolase [Planctomycetales bacterium]|nr:MBL fold metallo-hydrolase [Planctomycetales bacterium]